MITITAVLLLATLSGAEVPHLIGFQGQLTEGGNPVNGEVEISFKIYNVETGGSPMWIEVQMVTVEEGRYSVLLGSGTTLDGIEFTGDRWLALHVTGQSEMAPRYRLATSPFSLRAKVADSVASLAPESIDSSSIKNSSLSLLDLSGGGAAVNQVLKWTGDEWQPFDDAIGAGYDYWSRSGNLVYVGDTLDSVSIGSDTALAPLYVDGTARITGALVTGASNYQDSSHWLGAIVGGTMHTTYDNYAFLGGGFYNCARYCTAIVGGNNSCAHGSNSFVGGGVSNFIGANGDQSAILAGESNSVNGDYSVAAGYRASVVGDGSFVFADNSSSSFFESTANWQFLIRASNGVGINTASPSEELDVNGDIRCVSLTQTSDARFKKNVRSIDQPLARLMSLHGVRFDWDQEAESAPNLSDQPQIGLIAQEVEQQFPELVATDNQGYKSVDYGKMTAVLLEAVKELQLQNEKLSERVKELEESM